MGKAEEMLQSINDTLKRIEINLQNQTDPVVVADSVAKSLKRAIRDIL